MGDRPQTVKHEFSPYETKPESVHLSTRESAALAQDPRVLHLASCVTCRSAVLNLIPKGPDTSVVDTPPLE